MNQQSLKKNNLVDSESRYSTGLYSIITLLAVTGFSTYFKNSVDAWSQWLYLLHALFGIGLLFICTPYIYIHIKRTFGMRRISVNLSGAFLLAIVLILLLTGGFGIIFGQYESYRWIETVHFYISVVLVIGILIHIALHILTLPSHRKKNTKTVLLTLNLKRLSLKSTYGLLAVGVITAGLVMAQIGFNVEPYASAVVKNYQYPYGNNPYLPSQTKTLNNRFINVKKIANSSSCQSCHQEIYNQWQSSMHSLAASDKTYVTNVSLLEKKKGTSATRYCEGCHAPVALLTGELSLGGKHGGTKGTAAFQEGVGCLGCHGISRIVNTKGVASFEFMPQQGYLFENSENPLLLSLNRFLIRVNTKKHRAEMNQSVISKPELCATCHAQFIDYEVNEWGWVKMQDEYSAWLKSPFSGMSRHTFSHQQSKSCVDCHFPLTEGHDPSKDKAGQIVSHRSLAANTAIPFLRGDKEQVKLSEQFLQANKIRVTIDLPNRKDAQRDAKFVDEALVSSFDTPAFAYLGEEVTFQVGVSNVGVGHDFPGGTTDINQVWLWTTISDAQNNVIYQSGHVDSQNEVDDKAVFFHAIPIDRTGKHVWKHDLFNMVGVSYKKTIPAGKTEIIEQSFKVPSWVKGPLNISAGIKYRKFNTRYAKWALQDEYQDLPIVDMAWDSAILPILKKPAIQDDIR